MNRPPGLGDWTPRRAVGLVRALAILAVLAAFLGAGTASAQWSATALDLGPVTAIVEAGGEVFVEAGGWSRIYACDTGLCSARGRPPAPETARDGIPGGAIAGSTGPGILEAWYGDPTGRYDHGILGDRIEGGSLIVVDDSRITHSIVLPQSQVFEDLTPRLADVNGDGRTDVVAIRTDIAAGAAIAVYTVPDSALIELASIPPIGLTHRWLNVAGIADFNGDGQNDIAIVKTPHIGGRLEIWTMRGGDLVRLAAAEGFSNHAIGSTELGMAAVADFNGDGIADLAVPDAARRALRIVTLSGGAIADLAAVGLPAQITTAIAAIPSPNGPVLLLGLAHGRLVQIAR